MVLYHTPMYVGTPNNNSSFAWFGTLFILSNQISLFKGIWKWHPKGKGFRIESNMAGTWTRKLLAPRASTFPNKLFLLLHRFDSSPSDVWAYLWEIQKCLSNCTPPIFALCFILPLEFASGNISRRLVHDKSY